jgi:hypothetical protein
VKVSILWLGLHEHTNLQHSLDTLLDICEDMVDVPPNGAGRWNLEPWWASSFHQAFVASVGDNVDGA